MTVACFKLFIYYWPPPPKKGSIYFVFCRLYPSSPPATTTVFGSQANPFPLPLRVARQVKINRTRKLPPSSP